MVGEDIYYKLIKGYTEKQWGRKATELPAFIIKRLPLRYTFDNNYQGIPMGGYNELSGGLLEGIDIQLGVNYFKNKESLEKLASKRYSPVKLMSIIITSMVNLNIADYVSTMKY